MEALYTHKTPNKKLKEVPEPQADDEDYSVPGQMDLFDLQ